MRDRCRDLGRSRLEFNNSDFEWEERGRRGIGEGRGWEEVGIRKREGGDEVVRGKGTKG